MKHLTLALVAALHLPALATAQTITSTTESTPHPGIRIVEGRTSGPSTDFYAAYVSLCNDSVHVDASGYGSSTTSGAWASSVGAELAVNGDFFAFSPRAHIYGDAVAGGVRWADNRTGLHADYSGEWYYERYGWIAFGDDFVEFTNTEWVKNNFDTFKSLEGWEPRTIKPSVPPGTKALVSGFPQLVIDGQRITCSSPTDSSCFPDRTDMRARHPRTAMGLSRDRQTFILVVVDGRRTSSVGMYGSELAKLMQDLGAHVAFNLDGGGSSQMWVRGQGTINRPSDGSPRSVLNHWGIFAGGDNGLSAIPGHCDNRWDGLVHELQGQVQRTTDLDGDGNGDACIRTPTGVQCHLFQNGAFGPAIEGPKLEDGSGWADPSNYATMRWGDIDGDGRADLCARANAKLICWKFDGEGFGAGIDVAPLSDDSGFFRPMYYSTIRLADVNGDGMDDACARWSDGMKCYLSTGDAFASEPIVAGAFTNDNGWDQPSRYGTIRFGDIDGDGLDDVCGRSTAEMRCWRSDGTGFGQQVDGPAWSDANGWTAFRYYSTIRLIDLDDDGRADLCARSAAGLECHLSQGDSFGPRIAGPAIDDDSGWRDYSNYSSLRFADVTGDGLLDACARANAGIRCWPFDGAGFGAAISGPLKDESGWTNERFHRTIDFVDLDADGRADLCARAARGLVCWRSTGTAFEEPLIEGPAWSDEAGFGGDEYYSTMTLLGAVRPVPEEPEPPVPGADTGVPGPAPDGGIPPGAPDAGMTPSPDTGPQSPYGPDGGPAVINSEAGCACDTAPHTPVPWLLIAALALLVGPLRRLDSRR